MLGVSLVAIKAYYLGPLRDGLSDYVRSLAAISYVDVIFATMCWAAARLVLVFAWRRPLLWGGSAPGNPFETPRRRPNKGHNGAVALDRVRHRAAN